MRVWLAMLLIATILLVNFLLGHAQYAWLNITAIPMDISLFNDLPLSCEICYVTLHEQSPQTQWCYPLHYKEEAELVCDWKIAISSVSFSLAELHWTFVHCALWTFSPPPSIVSIESCTIANSTRLLSTPERWID